MGREVGTVWRARNRNADECLGGNEATAEGAAVPLCCWAVGSSWAKGGAPLGTGAPGSAGRQPKPAQV